MLASLLGKLENLSEQRLGTKKWYKHLYMLVFILSSNVKRKYTLSPIILSSFVVLNFSYWDIITIAES